MHPAKVDRDRLRRLTDLPNVGPAMARDYARLGFETPAQLAGVDALELYALLCARTGAFQDPCVLDTLLSVSHFLAGGEALPWWSFTARRNREHGDAVAALREAWVPQSRSN
ncbi:MAG TPA: helix-hairpin-helix domain-containing protein [Rhodanobacteraceae bacterium]